jgi:RHS repeat-associated protein
VFAGTRHLATYSGGATGTTNSIFADGLGTERVRTTYAGVVCEKITSLPFGDGQTSTGSCGDPSPLHCTGKERDLESGLDNFGARYMSSSMGRWVSPDRLNVTDDRLTNPSNTLNKYVYGADNPLRFLDPDGRDIVALYEPPNPLIGSAGHFMLFANNPQTGESAMMSFGELDSSVSGRLLTGTGTSMSSTKTFDWPQSADDLRQNFAALSIQTTPEEAQDVINYIKNFSPSSTDYKLFSQNCTTICRDAMKAIGLIPKNNNQITPSGFWMTVYNRYSQNTLANRFLKGAGLVPTSTGRDYGNPRFGMNTFEFIMLQFKPACVESWDPKTYTLHGCN